MGKVKGFKEYDRIDEKYIPVRKRLKSYKEFTICLLYTSDAADE